MKRTIYFHKIAINIFVLLIFFLVNFDGLLSQPSNNEFSNTSNEVLKLIKSADFNRLSEYVHKSRGLQFSPYDNVYEGGLDVIKFLKHNVKNFMTIKKVYVWGVYDGSGFDIKLIPKEYYNKFIYDIDFKKKADVVFIGNIKSKASKEINIDLDYIFKAYPKSTIAHYYYKGSLGNSFCDFKKLTLVFEKLEEKWFLVGIIHGEKGV
jgi:hypothetical protein